MSGDELRQLIRELAETVHATGSIRDHSDPTDTTGWNVHRIETCGDPLCIDALAALDTSPDVSAVASLDEAWAEAEAALPKGHVLAEVKRSIVDGEWYASTDNLTGEGRYHWSATGYTPVAALRALAARLVESQE